MQFLYQNVLFVMLIPIIFMIILLITKKSKLDDIFSKEILSKLSISNKHLTKQTRNIILFMALIFMTLALSRPVINEKEQDIKQEFIPLIIAIDISKSMLAKDIFPSRLELAKKKIIDLISDTNNLSIGIILFAKSSFILSPMTNDFTSLKFMINNFQYNSNINDGSDILSMLEASNKILKDYPSKNIILLSDGGNKDTYEEEILFANENNIKVYSIGLATNKPTPIPFEKGFITNNQGEIVTVKLNENIKNLSLETNAAYINYTLNNSDIKQIVNEITKNSLKTEAKSKKYKVYTELFYYPLAFSIFLLFIAFSSLPKIKKLSFLFLLLFIFSDNNYASILDFKQIEKANEAYNKEEYEKASNSFKDFINTPEGKYNFANALYKEKKYKSALKTYLDIETSNQDLEFKKLHNLGNTYVKMNDLENAKKMYEKALKIKKDKETKENLDLVNKQLENKKNPQNQQNKDNKKSENKKNEEDKKNEKNKENKNNKQNKDKNEKTSKESKKEEKQKQKQDKNNKDDEQTKKQAQEISEKHISNKEEKKWLKLLEKQKTPVLLRKMETKSDNKSNSLSPW